MLQQFQASDGYRFYYRSWEPEGRPKGRIVCIHGIRSHGGWYLRSCQRLAEAGFEVHLLDRRGSGLNTAHRGDCVTYRRLIDDIAEFTQHHSRSKPWLKNYLFGISWGGKLVTALPYRHPGLIDGLILACPGMCAKVRPPLRQRLRILVCRILRPGKVFPIPLNEAELFTDDLESQAYIHDDCHGLTTASARFLFASRGLDVYLRRARRRVTMPVLLLLADGDRIIDNARTRQYALTFPSKQIDVIDYRNAAHTLEFEGEGHPYIKDVVRWCERQNR